MTGPTLIRPLSDASDVRAFDRLNRRWISEHFTLTPEDERILSRPRESIIAPGGQVLVAADAAGTVVAVVAVLATSPGVYELAKMTVDEAARGQGLGKQLIHAAITWTREHGGHLLFLGTNSKLAPAIRLYEAAGFERTSIDSLGLHDYYARADVLMKLDLASS
ncbi:GNAT family N-acetyltransferase [Herbiconiux liukaitaii]|uniref:GNAT family N-acetyltransferase n=1 Tax=Herbiconiux liukaitaii TaxID=3342799 RepID=UPI0035BB2FC9